MPYLTNEAPRLPVPPAPQEFQIVDTSGNPIVDTAAGDQFVSDKSD